MPAMKTLVRLLLALTIAVASCVAAAPPAKGGAANPKTNDGSDPNDQTTSDKLTSSSSNSSDIPFIQINITASNANASEIDPDRGVRGPNCHRPDTEGIIRFVVMVASLTETRALSYRFRQVEPNGDLVAAAAAAKAEAGSVDSKAARNRAAGNDSESGNEFRNAAASVNMGNMSLQLLGMTEYSYTPSLYTYDQEGLHEFSREPIEALLKDLKNEVSEKIRPITCLLFRYPVGLSKIYNSWYLSPILLDVVSSTLKTSGFRTPGRSHLSSELASEINSKDELTQKWIAINFLMGNFAIDPSVVDIDHRHTSSDVKHRINTSAVIDMNDVSMMFIMEANALRKTNESVEYSRVSYPTSYPGMGMRESVLHFAGFDFAHDTLDKNNKTVHKTYEVPCLASNVTLNYTYLDVKNVRMHGLGGKGDSCFDRVLALTGDKIPEKDVTPEGDQTVYAISGAYDLMQYLLKAGIGNVKHSTTVCPTASFACDALFSSVEEVKTAAKTLCQSPPRKGTMELFYCINLAFLDRLLRDIPGLIPEATFIAIGPHPSYDWPLGLSVLYIQISILQASDRFDWEVTRRKASQVSASNHMIWTLAAGLLLLKLMLPRG